MGDYAPNYTARLKFEYQVQGKRHVLITRYPTVKTIANAAVLAAELYDALSNLAPLIYSDWALTDVSWCERNGLTFLPVSWLPPDALGSASTTGRPANQAAMQATFPYKTTAGGRGYIALFGTKANVYGDAEQDFRVYSTEDANVEATVTALNALDLAGNDAAAVAGFKPYMNVSLNRRWVKRLRNG